MVTVKVLMSHVMETGQRKNDKGEAIPAHFIQHVTVTHKGRVVLAAQWGTSIAANPFTWFVDRLRAALLEGRIAPEAGDLAALVVALALFAAGRWTFRRLSPHFEDFV